MSWHLVVYPRDCIPMFDYFTLNVFILYVFACYCTDIVLIDGFDSRTFTLSHLGIWHFWGRRCFFFFFFPFLLLTSSQTMSLYHVFCSGLILLCGPTWNGLSDVEAKFSKARGGGQERKPGVFAIRFTHKSVMILLQRPRWLSLTVFRLLGLHVPWSIMNNRIRNLLSMIYYDWLSSVLCKWCSCM